ncbi:MAG: MBOAT family protein [Myxococcales bacterium]|nr:MBOAT family protein [Myxococcales bacterium]MCB9533974.1 MBOAT family protein [Myxococcales bacterium]
MTFESVQFGLFVLATLAAYWSVAAWREAQKFVLLVASAVFYALLAPRFLPLLAGSILVNHVIAARLGPEAPSSGRWMRVGLAFNLGLLGLFKYYNFFRDTVDGALGVFGASSHLPASAIVLPLGISFYSFQAIAYLVELHRGSGPRARNLLDFAVFQALFLQLLMGPICRAKTMLPQLERTAPRTLARVPEAMSRIAVGLFKRMILASALFGHGVAESFFAPDNFSAAALWVSLLGYTVQIYCDFSGYVDLMRGIALLFGLDIPDNFANPYVATSVGDFWRRWHITFSNWLRDFIYLPLGGSRVPKHRVYFNLFMTMFVCGLWHGASWGYIIWGTLHGLALVAYKVGLDRQRARGVDPKKVAPTRVAALRGWVWTMGVVCFSRVFFVAPNLGTAAQYLRRLVDFGAPGAGFDRVLVIATLIGLGWNFFGDRVRAGHETIARRLPPAGQLVFYGATLLFLLLIRPGGVSPNAYFGF